jgi:alpha-mannosidase
MHQWLDFSDGEKGVAFLNNGKYGFDSDETHVGLSLLRAPHMREGELIGLGEFSFSYAVLPHAGDWRAAELPKLGDGFHHDLLLVDAERHEGVKTGMPRLFIAEAANILITAVKKAERDGAMIVRLFESQGRATRTVIHAPSSLADAAECDLLEREAGREDCALEQSGELQVTGARVSVSFKPYEIKTVKFRLVP